MSKFTFVQYKILLKTKYVLMLCYQDRLKGHEVYELRQGC